MVSPREIASSPPLSDGESERPTRRAGDGAASTPHVGTSTGRALLVVIDPGHGGEKDGAIGPNQLKEKDAALAICLRLREELEALGHRVILTRDGDRSIGLAARIGLANEWGADLFVSVHLNSLPLGRQRLRVTGVETYFLSADASDADAAALAHAENADDDVAEQGGGEASSIGAILADLAHTEAHAGSSRLAYFIHSHLVQGTEARDRGVRQAPFAVLRGAEMPAVLVEVGYLSHPDESKRLAREADQQRIGRSIARGVEAFRHEILERGYRVHATD